ncbi:MAG: hypothetical protein GEU75_04510 [Dehalococcoidia bacterium]|nr:hypothetical protein [Dehalococcoidia bacterium]
MAESKKKIAKAAEQYARELREEFSKSEPEVIIGGPDGFDVWIRLLLPAELIDESYDEIMDTIVRLDHRYYEETGVSIVTTLAEKEPVTNV